LSGTPLHVPYRNSKLTRILSSALGGNAKTALVVTCSAERANWAETLATLRFGSRAACIQTRPTVNTSQTESTLRVALEAAHLQIREQQLELQQLHAYVRELQLAAGMHAPRPLPGLGLALSGPLSGPPSHLALSGRPMTADARGRDGASLTSLTSPTSLDVTLDATLDDTLDDTPDATLDATLSSASLSSASLPQPRPSPHAISHTPLASAPSPRLQSPRLAAGESATLGRLDAIEARDLEARDHDRRMGRPEGVSEGRPEGMPELAVPASHRHQPRPQPSAALLTASANGFSRRGASNLANLPPDLANLPPDPANLPPDLANLLPDPANLPPDLANLPPDPTNLPPPPMVRRASSAPREGVVALVDCGPDVLASVLSYLGADVPSLLACAATCTDLRDAASAPSIGIWSDLYAKRFGFEAFHLAYDAALTRRLARRAPPSEPAASQAPRRLTGDVNVRRLLAAAVRQALVAKMSNATAEATRGVMLRM